MKETRPVGNPTITLEFHCEDRAWRLLGVMGLGTLQRKDVMMTAKSCSGALLPSSFGRVTDLGFEGKSGHIEKRRCDACVRIRDERHASGTNCGFCFVVTSTVTASI